MLRRFRPPLAVALVLLAALGLLAAPVAHAQDAATESASAEAFPEPGPYGLGFTSSWPSYGISGTLDLSDKITAEVVLGLLGTVSNFSGRAWYRFRQEEDYDVYAYGGAGLYRWSGSVLSENSLAFGAGGGVEASLARLLDDADFPPVFVNTEVGLAFANFRYYNFSSFVFGVGIRYRFGGE